MLALCFLGLTPTTLAQEDPSRGTFRIKGLQHLNSQDQPSQPGTPGFWKLTWDTQAGVSYRLERNKTLQPGFWEEVVTILAEESEIAVRDELAGLDATTFWRVIQLDATGGEENVSDVITGVDVSGSNRNAVIQITTGEVGSIQSVTFLQEGVPVGNGQPGFDGTWNFAYAYDGGAPRIVNLVAAMEDAEGDVVQIPVQPFLVADPTRFVPLDPEDRPLYGEFIIVSEDGTLGTFLYYPEGIGDPDRTTGVHFEFPNGANLSEAQGRQKLDFSSGVFHRGYADPDPVSMSGNLSRLDLEAINPEQIAQAFNLPQGQVELCWGDGCVLWESGALSSDGWASLEIDPGLGSFNFPSGRLETQVTFNPESREAYLVTRFFGQWKPADGVSFNIPEMDPLMIYLSHTGEIIARGTAEANFANGANVKGSLHWEAPYFHFRFEGKGIVIPSMTALRNVLPFNPNFLNVFQGNTDEELDRLSDALRGYLASQRSLALGTLANLEGEVTSFATVLPPSMEGHSNLSAWAGRMESWSLEYPVEPFADEASSALQEAIRDSIRSVSALDDLQSTLEYMEATLTIRTFMDPVISASERPSLQESVELLTHACIAASSRILTETPEFPLSAATEKTFSHLADMLDRLNQSSQQGNAQQLQALSRPNTSFTPRQETNDSLETKLQNIREQLIRKLPSDFFSNLDIQKNNFREDNPILASMTLEDIFNVLQKTQIVLDAFLDGNPITPVSGFPEDYPVLETLQQCQPFLFEKLNQRASLAIERKDGALLRKSLMDRGRMYSIYQSFGNPLALNEVLFTPGFQLLVDAYYAYLGKNLPIMTPEQRLEQYDDFSNILLVIAESANNTNSAKEQIIRILNQLESGNDSLAAALAADPHCGVLMEDLKLLGYSVVKEEGVSGIHPISGKYESESHEPLMTIQVNRAGKYFQGNIQYRQQGKNINPYQLKGLLLREENDLAEFAFQRYTPSTGRVSGSGTAIFTKTINEGFSLRYVEVQGTKGTFNRVSGDAIYSDSTVDRFPPKAKEVLLALKQAPLHSEEKLWIVEMIDEIKPMIRDYIRLKDELKRSAQASQINARFGNLRNKLSIEQDPLIRLLLQLDFSANYPSIDESGLNDLDLPYQSWLLRIFQNEQKQNNGISIDAISKVLGPSITSQLQGSIRYDLTLESVTAPVDNILSLFEKFRPLLKRLPVSPDATYLLLKVKKTKPNGEPEFFELDGLIVSGKLGLSVRIDQSFSNANALITAASETNFPPQWVDYDYRPEELIGPVIQANLSGVVSAGIGLKSELGMLTFLGKPDGSQPPIVVFPPIVSVTPTTEIGAAANIGFGYLISDDEGAGAVIPENLTGSVGTRYFESQSQVAFDRAFGFEFNSDKLSPCGWQQLREFIAEYRALFNSPDATVRIYGLTDTVGDANYNLSLSERRAEAVSAAMLDILGPSSSLDSSNIITLGLGEKVADSNFNVTEFPEEVFTQDLQDLVTFLRSERDTIANNTAAPSWRTVQIIINDLVRFAIRGPKNLP